MLLFALLLTTQMCYPLGQLPRHIRFLHLKSYLLGSKHSPYALFFISLSLFLYLARVCCCIICLVLYYLYYFRPSILCTDRVSFTPHLGALASESWREAWRPSPKDPPPRWIQEPLVVRDRDGRPPRGPPRSALLLYVAGVHCWEISLSKQIHGTSVIFVNENENYQKRKNSDSVNEN